MEERGNRVNVVRDRHTSFLEFTIPLCRRSVVPSEGWRARPRAPSAARTQAESEPPRAVRAQHRLGHGGSFYRDRINLYIRAPRSPRVGPTFSSSLSHRRVLVQPQVYSPCVGHVLEPRGDPSARASLLSAPRRRGDPLAAELTAIIATRTSTNESIVKDSFAQPISSQ